MDGCESSELADEGLALLLSSCAFGCYSVLLTLLVGCCIVYWAGLDDWVTDAELLLEAEECARRRRRSRRSFGKIVFGAASSPLA